MVLSSSGVRGSSHAKAPAFRILRRVSRVFLRGLRIGGLEGLGSLMGLRIGGLEGLGSLRGLRIGGLEGLGSSNVWGV